MGGVALRIALRYLFSRKKHNAVNIISIVSVAAVAVATAATVIVMSVFNGFSELAARQLSFLSPPLLVSPASGRIICNADSLVNEFSAAGITALKTVETQGVAVAGECRMAVRILGVPEEFMSIASLDSVIIDGEPSLLTTPADMAVASVGVALGLETRPSSYRFITLYTPKREGRINTASTSSFRTADVVMSAVYQVNQDQTDADMILVPLTVAQNLASLDSVSGTSVWVYPGSAERAVVERIAGTGTTVRDRLQQQASSFRMISVEKWITYAMLVFIILIASFNIISTLAILVIEKEPNMQILRAMGASPGMCNRIFIYQGWLITAAGGVAGIIIGVILSLLQEYFGLIKLNATDPSALLITTYPVVLRVTDILAVAATVIVIATLTGLTAIRRVK